jgi:hypothetical protein
LFVLQESADLLFECVTSSEAANAPPQLATAVDSAQALLTMCKSLAAKVIARRPEEAMAAGLIAPPAVHHMPAEGRIRSESVSSATPLGPSRTGRDLVGDISAIGGLERFVAAQIERAAATTSEARSVASGSGAAAVADEAAAVPGAAEPRVAVARLLRARADRDELFGASATRADSAHERAGEGSAGEELEELEGATDVLLRGAQDMTSALQTSMGMADAVASAVERNLEATQARISRLKQHSSAVGWAFLGHIAAVMAAMAAFTVAYLLIRVLPRGSIL